MEVVELNVKDDEGDTGDPGELSLCWEEKGARYQENGRNTVLVHQNWLPQMPSTS